jgi:hypothetical protein
MRLYRIFRFSLAWLILGCLAVPSFVPATEGGTELSSPRVAQAAEAVFTRTQYLPLIIQRFYARSVFGVEMRQIDSANGLEQVGQAGTTWVRFNGVRWADVEPQEGARNWSALAGLEEGLRRAAQENLQVVMVVRHTPEWARKYPLVSCGPIKEEKLLSFGVFLHDLVSRYSAPPYNVKYWELYNEPEVDPYVAMQIDAGDPFGCWGDPADIYYGGRYYAEMLKYAYAGIKTADPASQVLVGGLLLDCDHRTVCVGQAHPRFFEGILVNNGGNYFDGVAFHSYDYFLYGTVGAYNSPNWRSRSTTTGPALIAKARFLKDFLAMYNVTGKFLMSTETALLCGNFWDPPGGYGCEPDPGSPFENIKANYVVHSYTAAIAEGLRASVWYHVQGWRNSGLLNTDLTPRPAYLAFEFARRKLGNATFLEEIESQDLGGETGLKGYKFQRPSGRRIWVLWSLTRDEHAIVLPGAPVAVWDLLGNPVTPGAGNSLTVTLKPLYIEWDP